MAYKELRKFKIILTAPSIHPTTKTMTEEIEAKDEDDVMRWWKAVKDTPKYKGFNIKSTEAI